MVQIPAPLSMPFDRFFDQQVRTRFFKGMDFAGPKGDPGWFGPGSAVWYVHSNMPVMFFGLVAAATMESLDPETSAAGYDHSRLIERKNGKPTGRLRPEGAAVRFAHSLAFFVGTAYGSTETAEKCARIVRAMHGTVHGVSTAGLPYDARDPELLRWNYANVVWGMATAHERYHLRPLKDIDEYYGEFARVGEALGGTDLPASKVAVREVLDGWAPKLALLPSMVPAIWPNNRHSVPMAQRPVQDLFTWAARDIQPRWARQLYLFSRPDRVQTFARRQAVKALLNGLHVAAGPLREYRQAQARVHGVPLQPIRFDAARVAAGSRMSRRHIEALGGDSPFELGATSTG